MQQNSELLFELDRENKEKWTEEQYSKMTDQQKVRLVELVYHMNPEVQKLSIPVRNKWIKILSGIYIRYIRKCPVEDYNTKQWREKQKKIALFDVSILEKQQ